jgi:hypothetical protein
MRTKRLIQAANISIRETATISSELCFEFGNTSPQN